MTDGTGHRVASDPRPPFPIGWYRVTESDQIGAGDVVSRSWLGEAVVAFRGRRG